MNYQIVCVIVQFFILGQAAPVPCRTADSFDSNGLDKTSLKTAVELHKEEFRIPRTLKIEDKIEVIGQMKKDRERFTVSLVAGNGRDEPDYKNIACQVHLDFPTESSTKNMITIKTIVNGNVREFDEDTQSTGLFEDLQFAIQFKIEEGKIAMLLKESSTIHDCVLEYGQEVIQYLTVEGDVHKVEAFNFLPV